MKNKARDELHSLNFMMMRAVNAHLFAMGKHMHYLYSRERVAHWTRYDLVFRMC